MKMRVFLNPGHAPDGEPDPGACNPVTGLRECDVARAIADLVEEYLTAAGVEVVGNLQSDDLHEITATANNFEPDVFVSIHCNSFNTEAHGTEVWHYHTSRGGRRLAECIQSRIVHRLGTADRGVKRAAPHTGTGLYVLTNTDAVAVLVETAFIDHAEEEKLLASRQDDFARAIACGITDYEQEAEEI